MRYRTDERQTFDNIADTKTAQVAASSQTDEDITIRRQPYHFSLVWMIFQFFCHMIDIKRGHLIDQARGQQCSFI